jgi:hypothetical protein
MEAPAPVSGGALALSPALAGGRRHKLKLVTKKKARKALKKLGLKMRGGADAGSPTDAVAVPAEALKAGGMSPEEVAAAPAATMAGRRGGKKTKKRSASRRRSSIFGL